MTRPRIVWLRRDLRLADQQAFAAAAQNGPVIPVYVLDDDTPKHRKLGGASRWWLHKSLASLSEALHSKGSRLILRGGNAAEEIARIARETDAQAVHCLRHYEPWWRNAERALAKALEADGHGGCELICHDGNYLLPPGALTTGSGGGYKIFTPFWNALKDRLPPDEPTRAPAKLAAPGQWPKSDTLADWDLLPTRPDWSKGFEVWTPGEDAAHRRLKSFAGHVGAYDRARNMPSEDGSSRLSPHLHWGELSPAQVWHGVKAGMGDASEFLRELGWRDFAQNIILQFPDYPAHNYREKFDGLKWRRAPGDLARWQQGLTGYPIVDAGMRQLWATGWMHNRVRMIAASFLIKHLLIDWREGERWFWDTLVDADYGNNAVNWQWVSGTGVDSQMFPRIMAPLVQSPKFDAAGYIREWVPELAGLSDDDIHDPDGTGVRPDSYPAPIIAHREARERALAAYGDLG